MKTTKIGVTFGLCRYSGDIDASFHSEQVYVHAIDEPLVLPHPDGGEMTPRTIRIVNGRGYDFRPVLDLTDDQAIEMAKVILDHFGEKATGVGHPHRRFIALGLRAKAENVARALNEAADELEKA